MQKPQRKTRALYYQSNTKKILWIILFCGLYLFGLLTTGWAEESLKVAAIFPQTGKAKTYGSSSLKGTHIAVKEINQTGGLLGAPLKLIVIDNKSSPLHAQKAARQAAEMNVSIVIGGSWSTQSLAMAPVLQEAGIPMISPSATAPEVTQVGSYIFRSCYTDTFQGRLMASFAYNELNAHTAAVLTNMSETYSQALASQFIAFFKEIGGKIIVDSGYKGSAIDFRNDLEPVKRNKPDVVFIPGYSRDSGLIIRQARAMGISAIFVGGDAWEKNIANYAGPGLEGSYFSTFWHSRVSSRESLNFANIYFLNYDDREISPYAAQAYDAIHLFADAVRRAGSSSHDSIRQALQKTSKYKGATGSFSFDESGDPENKGAAILKFTRGQWNFYKWIDPITWKTSKQNERRNSSLQN